MTDKISNCDFKTIICFKKYQIQFSKKMILIINLFDFCFHINST